MIVDRHGRRHYPAGTPESKGGEFAPGTPGGGGHITDMDRTYTDAQRKALQMYSSWEYHDINRQLRQGRVSPHLQTLVDDIRSAMAPTPHAATVYRRASGRDFGLGEYATTAQIQQVVGQRFEQPAFMSATLDESGLAGHPGVVHLEVAVPAGTQAAYLHNAGLDHDQELLLDIGQRFELLSAEPMSAHETRVRVRILPSWVEQVSERMTRGR
jgi:hypothetical protein